MVRVAVVGAGVAAAVALAQGTAGADPWIPHVPGPDPVGPGANILWPGTPLPPGHLGLPPPGHIPGVADLVPNVGHGWH